MANFVGVFGMGVMGQSLALNIARHGYSVSVYNRHGEVTEGFIKERVNGHPIYEKQIFATS
jgi:6-phosphogluconate dehydrogenase